MFWTNVKRVVRSGFMSFWRNAFVTIASILVMTTTLFVLGLFIFLNAMLESSLQQIEQKVDVNVYFEVDATEQEILAVRDELLALPEVEDIEYVSRDEAIALFQERHAGDELILGALEELDENPLGAYLNIQATDAANYDEIAEFIQSADLTGANGQSIIDNVNYFQNRDAINALTDILDTIDWLSVVVLIFFVIISILITFNTIRLAIYNSREEISVMKLVGASNTYIQSPFVIEGIMYGIVSALFALLLFYPLSLWLGPTTETFFGATNMFDYYVDNFAQLFLVLVLFGVALGAVSSFLAVKKYLRV